GLRMSGERLSGTGTSFGSTSATATGSITQSRDHPNGHFSASLSTTWSSATQKTFMDVTVSCAPSTASITLSNGTSSTANFTGKACSWTRSGTTKYAFFGRTSDGTTRAFLREDGTTIKGFVFMGMHTVVPMSLDTGVQMGLGCGFSCDHH